MILSTSPCLAELTAWAYLLLTELKITSEPTLESSTQTVETLWPTTSVTFKVSYLFPKVYTIKTKAITVNIFN